MPSYRLIPTLFFSALVAVNVSFALGPEAFSELANVTAARSLRAIERVAAGEIVSATEFAQALQVPNSSSVQQIFSQLSTARSENRLQLGSDDFKQLKSQAQLADNTQTPLLFAAFSSAAEKSGQTINLQSIEGYTSQQQELVSGPTSLQALEGYTPETPEGEEVLQSLKSAMDPESMELKVIVGTVANALEQGPAHCSASQQASCTITMKSAFELSLAKRRHEKGRQQWANFYVDALNAQGEFAEYDGRLEVISSALVNYETSGKVSPTLERCLNFGSTAVN